jgi:hypothetical protein
LNYPPWKNKYVNEKKDKLWNIEKMFINLFLFNGFKFLPHTKGKNSWPCDQVSLKVLDKSANMAMFATLTPTIFGALLKFKFNIVKIT